MIKDDIITYYRKRIVIFELEDFKDDFKNFELHIEFNNIEWELQGFVELYLYHTTKRYKMKLPCVMAFGKDECEFRYTIAKQLLNDKEKTIAYFEQVIEEYKEELNKRMF